MIIIRTNNEASGGSLFRAAQRLALFTVVYNILEGVASLVAGALAGSISLTGFGLDSFVESLSGAVMLWRLRRRDESDERAESLRERRAIRLIGLSFFLFAAYIFVESLRRLYSGEAPEPSLFGIVIALASLVVMPVLYIRKLRVGRALGLRSLIADSKETLACVFLSASLLTGLVLNSYFGIRWADPVAGIFIAGFLIREGIEAISGEEEE